MKFDLERGPDNHFYLVSESRNGHGKLAARKLGTRFYSFESMGDALKLDELFTSNLGVVANRLFVSARAKALIDQLCEDEAYDQLEKLEQKYLKRLNEELLILVNK